MPADAKRNDTGAAASDDGELPNVVFVLVDDLGWMNTSLYGSDYYETPRS